jgi:hypothetical protein
MEPIIIFLCVGILFIGLSIKTIINKCKASNNDNGNDNVNVNENETQNIVNNSIMVEVPPKYEDIYN